MLTLIPRGPGAPLPVRIDDRSATIGREGGVDLALADPNRMVSAKHCRIDFHGGEYVLTDTSTNGTAVNGRRLTAPHPLAEGDVLAIGPWQVAVSFAAGVPSPTAPAIHPDWQCAPVPASGATMQQPGPAPAGDAVSQLLHAAGIPRSAIAASDAVVLAAAGALLRQFTGGVMTMLEARAKARGELGVKPPPPSNNPLKKQAKAELALTQLLGVPQPAELALAEAFTELDAHQRATLTAMQGALRSTLNEFAPDALRQRNPKASDPMLWQAYDIAFTGQNGSSFIEVFAKELGTAYEKMTGSDKNANLN